MQLRVCFGNCFLSPSYYFVQPRCGDLPCTSLWLFMYYANVSSLISISLKIMLPNCMIPLFSSLPFFGANLVEGNQSS